MKRFNFKNPETQKWFLVSGLMLALGFNLSWNPENTHIARFEHLPHMAEFASNGELPPGKAKDDRDMAKVDTAPATTAKADDTKAATTDEPAPVANDDAARTSYENFNLRDVNSGFCNANVKFALDKSETGDQQKVIFSVEGDVCTDCDKIGSVLINMKNVEDNMAAIRLNIAQEAAKICKKGDDKKAADKDKGDKDDRKSKLSRIFDKDDSECDLEDDDIDSLLSCQQDELTALADSCDAIDVSKDLDKKTRRENKEYKSACESRVKSYFNRFVAKSLRKGLSDPNSDSYQTALDMRDSLLSDLPKKFDGSIRTSLVNLSTNAVYDQTKAFYNSCLSEQNCSAGQQSIATTKAQAYLAQQISAMGNPLWATMNYYGEDNDSTQDMLKLFQNQYQKPLVDYWNKSVSSNSLDLSASGLVNDSNLNGGAPSLTLGLNVSTEASAGADSRGNLRAKNALNVPVIPGAFGTANANGTPALMQSSDVNTANDGRNNLRATP